MIKKFLLNHTDRYLARWIILLFDVFIVGVSFVLALALRFNFDLGGIVDNGTFSKLPVVLFFYTMAFLASRSYVGIIRHTNVRDAVNVLKGSFLGAFCLFGLSVIEEISTSSHGFLYVPRSILLIHFFLTSFVLIGVRFLLKYFYDTLIYNKHVKYIRVLIYGAGSSGLTTMHTLSQDNSREYEVIGFVDDNPKKAGKAIGGYSGI